MTIYASFDNKRQDGRGAEDIFLLNKRLFFFHILFIFAT